MRLALLCLVLSGCIATQGLAKRTNRLSPRREGAALLGIGAAEVLVGAAITWACIYGKSKHEPSDSVTENLEAGAKDAAGRVFGAALFGTMALLGVGDLGAGLVQTTTGNYFIDPKADEEHTRRLDLIRRTPVNTTGNSDLDEPPRPPKKPSLAFE